METINITINGIAVEAPKGSTILQAAKLASIDIPTLCYLKEINEIGACRICMVEADEGRGATDFKLDHVEQLIQQEISLQELPDVLPTLLKGQAKGRTIVKL